MAKAKISSQMIKYSYGAIFYVAISLIIGACNHHNNDIQEVTFQPHNITPSEPLSSLPTNGNSIKFTIPKSDISNDPVVHLTDIQILVVPNDLKMKPIGSDIAFESTDNSIEIKIGSIFVSEIIRKNLNGVVAEIFLLSKCDNVTVQIHDGNSLISGTLVKDPASNNNSKIQDPVIRVSTPSFKIAFTTCSGANGFDQLIESAIRKDLENHDRLSRLIDQYLIPRLTQLDPKP